MNAGLLGGMAVAAALAAGLWADPSAARDIARGGTFDGPRGEITREVTGSGGDGTLDRSVTVTNGVGETRSRDAAITRTGDGVSYSVQGSEGRGLTGTGTRTRDPSTGTVTATGSATTNGGAVLTREAQRHCAPNDGTLSCAGGATLTGPRGTTTTTTERGGGQATVTRTGPLGRTWTRERWISVQP